MAEASRRVGWLGLVYAAGGVFGHFGRRALLISSRSLNARPDFGDALAVAGILTGLVVYVLSRRDRLSPKRLLDLGLVLEVAGAFGIASAQFWSGGPYLPDTSLTLIPAECIWIVAYPLVVPNTPYKVLVASLLAASMGPLALALSSAVAGAHIDAPLELVSYFLPNYLSALIAYVLARIVHRLSLRLKRAREVGAYELVERIGEGGMGDVWRARHRFLARPAAIKMIRGDVLG